jgi:hypothetical protein
MNNRLDSLAIVVSLRRESFNRRLANALVMIAPSLRCLPCLVRGLGAAPRCDGRRLKQHGGRWVRPRAKRRSLSV